VSQSVPLVSVVVPVYNAKRTLVTCLDSLIEAMNDVGRAELIVIDNGSSDGSFELLQDKYAHIAKICQSRGGTIGALRNLGARGAQGQYLCFIDADCVVSRTHFEKAMSVFERISPAATGCKYDLPRNPHWVEETWHNLHRRPRDGFVNYLNAGNFIVRKAVFDHVGGFDENLATDEDADLGWRLRAAGFKIFESHDVSAVHLGNPKDLREFFRKEAWHGLGMFSLRKHSAFDKVLLVFAAVALIRPQLSIGPRLGLALFGLLFVPALTVAYRFMKLRRIYRPFRSLLLYWLFFAAKVYALGARIIRQPQQNKSQ
jgi:glycosyltransferase involved in cell wall biosynthesis